MRKMIDTTTNQDDFNQAMEASVSSMEKDAVRPSSNIPSNWAQKWSPEEDERLVAAVKEFGEKNWKKVAELVGTRDAVKCVQRWEKGLKPGIVKGRWSEDEDRMLIYVVSQNLGNWGQVAQKMPGRTSKQCRERWINYLNPTLIHSPFTEEEDRILVRLQAELGNKWAEIARSLPGRTENAVKVRFNALTRQQRLRSSGSGSISDGSESHTASSDGSFDLERMRSKRPRLSLPQRSSSLGDPNAFPTVLMVAGQLLAQPLEEAC